MEFRGTKAVLIVGYKVLIAGAQRHAHIHQALVDYPLSPGQIVHAVGFIRHFALQKARSQELTGRASLFTIIFIIMFSRLTALTIIALFAILCAGGIVVGQKPLEYQTISTSEGLSQGYVFDILQDSEGFIWVATKNGLNRYDGYSFKHCVNDPYNSNSISSNTIVKLFEDSKGRLWVGTEDAGLNIYDKNTGKFHRLSNKVADASTISGNAIGPIEELPDGRILVAVNGAGLNIIQLPTDFFEKGAPVIITRLSLPNEANITGMGKDKTGTMYIGGQDRIVYSFHPSTNNFKKLPGAEFLDNGYMVNDSSIIKSDRNRFLFTGKDAIPLFDIKKNPAGNIVYRWTNTPWQGIANGLRHLKINFQAAYWQSGKSITWGIPMQETATGLHCFIVDRAGIVWAGTPGYGLRKYNIAGNRFKLEVPGFSTRWIVPAQNDQLYLGNFITHWRVLKPASHKDNEILKITNRYRVDNLLVTKAGDYWIQSNSDGYYNYNPSTARLVAWPTINNGEIVGDKQPMLEDSKGYIWLPGRSGVISRFNTGLQRFEQFTINTNAAKPILPQAGITSIFEDAPGVFWIGTQDGFVKAVFNGTNNSTPRVTWFNTNSNNRNSLNYKHVSGFINDPAEPEKYLWISTKGGGLNRFDKATGNFFHVTKKDGLPDDVVYGLIPDDSGNIWGSTNKGIFCMASPKKNSGKLLFRNFTKAEGLQGDEFNTGAYTKLPNGKLAFGGVNGLNIFDPKEILAQNFEPNVFITDILINNQPVYPNDKSGVLQNTIEQSKIITLTHLQDILTLEFSSLDFTAPLQNKYRYQLVGVDDAWVESGTRRSATYLHLPPGDYVFKVQGSNSQSSWSDKISELKIIVLPPWWKSWWAYTIYALLFAWGISAYFRFYVNRAKLKSQLAFEKIEAKRIKELDTLKTQLYTNITHEFRTPLTIILGIAQQLDGKPREEFPKGLNMIIRNGQSLLKLVNEMLDLSKLETGNMRLQLTNGDVIKFLRYVSESFHSLAAGQQKGVHFLTNIDALHVAYDAEKLRQIIANLISNALKFTPEKGNVYITISQNGIAGDDARVNLVMEVKDTGIGIPEDKLHNIFDRFYQLDNSHTRAAEGTGIGLSLTKELVKLMGGGITVQSPPPGATRGTSFTVVLILEKVAIVEEPMHYVVKNNELQEAAPGVTTIAFIDQQEKNKHHPLLLLVEDNADVVAYTASCLPDYRLAVGKDGREGFEIAREIIPDLIITDVMMPFVDGFEMVRRLRGLELTSHIPIIMLTAKAGIESKLEGLEHGADAYLEKPFHKEELLMRIKKLLELRKNLQKYYLRKSGISDSIPSVDIIVEDTELVNETENEFVKKVREVITNNLANAGFTVEQLCKLVFMSHSQLHRKLDALTGLSPNKFIRIIRLNKAKELLKNGAYSISSVAYECGYSDPAYFARVFRQEFGASPQEWRMSNMDA